MEDKHTPGLWTAEVRHRQGYDRLVPVWYVRAENGVGVAVQPTFSTDEHGEANARLIAAAPDLLHEAAVNSGILQALLVHLASHVSPKVADDIRERIAATDAAISKATASN